MQVFPQIAFRTEDGEMTADGELFADTLPTYLTQFVGRTAEITQVCESLQRHRLVSICGVGGSGKTRLAIEAARLSRTGDSGEVHWVPLGGISDDREVYAAVSAGIGLTGRLVVHAAVSALRNRRATIILDGCEAVLAGCREFIGAVLRESPEVTFLTTTRVPLGSSVEYPYEIPPLSNFRTIDSHDSDASTLFIDRSMLAVPGQGRPTAHDAEAIHAVCGALDGLPLAIELAAGWMRALSPEDLLGQVRRLRTRLDSRATTGDEGHRLVNAMLASSWAFLDPESRRVLGALAVFTDGFTREAAEVVAGADLGSLATFIDRALIQRLPASSGGSRYAMHALVRDYAWDQAEHRRQTGDRHAAYFAGLVDTLETDSWMTTVEPRLSDSVRADLTNVDAATRWALTEGHAGEACRLAVGLDVFCAFGSPSAELRNGRLAAALALAPVDSTRVEAWARARAAHVLGLRTALSNPAGARILMAQAYELFELIGDQRAAGAAIRDHGSVCLMLGDVDQGHRDARQSLDRCGVVGDRNGTACSLLLLGRAARGRENPHDAAKWFTEARQRFDQLGDRKGVCLSSLELGSVYAALEQWKPALDALHDVLVGAREGHLTAHGGDLIEAVAMIAAMWKLDESGARLCGAISTWQDTYEPIPWTGYRDRLDATTHLLKSRLDEGAWSAHHAAGRALNPEQSIALLTQLITELNALVAAGSSGLSGREIETLALVSRGLTNAEIAAKLHVSRRTVDAHLRSIYVKLDVTTRTGAVRAGMEIFGVQQQ